MFKRPVGNFGLTTEIMKSDPGEKPEVTEREEIFSGVCVFRPYFKPVRICGTEEALLKEGTDAILSSSPI